MIKAKMEKGGKKGVSIQGHSVKGSSGGIGKRRRAALTVSGLLGSVMMLLGCVLDKQGCSRLGTGVQRCTLA